MDAGGRYAPLLVEAGFELYCISVICGAAVTFPDGLALGRMLALVPLGVGQYGHNEQVTLPAIPGFGIVSSCPRDTLSDGANTSGGGIAAVQSLAFAISNLKNGLSPSKLHD